MDFHAHRRKIAGFALLIFLFSMTQPLLAAVQRAIDPIAYAAVCSTGTDNDRSVPVPAHGGVSGHDHCLVCAGGILPPPGAHGPCLPLDPVAVATPAVADTAPRANLRLRQPQAARAPPLF